MTDSSETKAASPILSEDRYSRQVLFPAIGRQGQQKLSESHIAVVGCGATGAAASALLARAGVGRITIIDRDYVEPSNLQRQMLFDEDDAANCLPKAEAARRHIPRFNSEIDVHAHIADLTPSNIDELLSEAHLILDATDNFETRYLLNDYCVSHYKPWIYTAAIGAYAATMNILPEGPSRTACLACIFPAPPTGVVETCDTAGILNTAVNLAASLAVTEALKFAVGKPESMRRTLFSLDLWTGERSEINTGTPRTGCVTCDLHQFPHLAGEGRPHITLCGRNSVQIHEHNRPVNFDELTSRLQSHGTVRSNSMLLRFELPAQTITVFRDGRALVQGTTDIAVARTLYARYIGS